MMKKIISLTLVSMIALFKRCHCNQCLTIKLIEDITLVN